MKITGTNNESHCNLCNSTSYGRSCPFGPKHTHQHTDDPMRCVWCGSTSLGPGCPFNPFGKYHQRGAVFNTLTNEAFDSGIVRGIIMKRLAEPITESRAFQMGLIDKDGNQIKELETIQERNALTPVDKYLIKLKKLAEKNIDMINTTLYFENIEEQYSIEDLKLMYPIELDCQNEIEEAVSTMYGVIDKFVKMGMSTSKIEKMIAESMLNVKTNEEGKQQV